MNIQNRDNFFTAGAHAIKKIKIYCSCRRFKATGLPQLFSTIKIVSVVVTTEQQNRFRRDLLILFNNLNIFLMNSNSFIRLQVRVQKKNFCRFKFEYGKMIKFFRVCSPVSFITAQQQTHITAVQHNNKNKFS